MIFAAGTPKILLPWDNAKVFRKNLEAHSEGQYASWTVWTAPTNLSPAAAAQRVGMSEADLRAVNGIPPRMLIKAGSALMVPRATTTVEDVSSQIADNGQLAFTPEIVTRRTTVRAGKRETVASIARRYRVSVDNVADWNDVKKNASFKNGQSVVMYLPVRLNSAVVARVPSADVKQTSARGKATPAASARAPAKHHTSSSSTSRKGGTPSKVQKKKR